MSNFGEIVEPNSRTVWEDWDENIDTHDYTSLKWQIDREAPDSIDTLYIFEGKYLSDCVKLQSHYNLETINSIPAVNLVLYKIANSSNFVCIVKDYNLIQSSEVVEELKQYLKISIDVIAIQTKPLSEYHCMPQPGECVIRTLTTNAPLAKVYDLNLKSLEQPNIISGISAGVISLRDHMQLSGIAIVCFIENPEEYQIRELHVLLENLQIHHIVHPTRPSSILNSNLYI